ncbi:MAG TPA: hypothetical protein VGK73_33190 [Polyangiaceae bacterium]
MDAWDFYGAKEGNIGLIGLRGGKFFLRLGRFSTDEAGQQFKAFDEIGLDTDHLKPKDIESLLPILGRYRLTRLDPARTFGWTEKEMAAFLEREFLEGAGDASDEHKNALKALAAKEAQTLLTAKDSELEVYFLTTPRTEFIIGPRAKLDLHELRDPHGLSVLPLAEMDFTVEAVPPPEPRARPPKRPSMPKPAEGETDVKAPTSEGEDVFGRGEAESGEGTGARPRNRRRPVYPPTKGDPADIRCEPFEGEPSIKTLGDDGKDLEHAIGVIAYRLQIKPCDYAGNFCLMAAEIIGHRAGAVGKFSANAAGELRSAAGDGNLGSVDFRLATTAGMHVLQYLAATVPLVTMLRDMTRAVLHKPEHAAKIKDTYQGDSVGWEHRLLIELSEWMRWSIGWLFVYGCQLTMLALLNTSAKEIQKRLDRFDSGYGAFFEELVRMMLFDAAELERMAERLNTAQAEELDSGGAVARELFATWKRGHRLAGDTDVLAEDALEGKLEDRAKLDKAWGELDTSLKVTAEAAGEAQSEPGPSPNADKIVRRGEQLAIVDKQGKEWTAGELQQAIALARGTAEAIDPLVKQIFDLPGTMDRFKAEPHRIQAHARALLLEMKLKNAEITAKTLEDDTFAFTRGPLGDESGGTDPRFMHTLTGLHKLVYDELAGSFAGDGYFAQGLDSVFNGRKGFEAVVEFFSFIGSALLAVLCPPLAMVVDAALAKYEMSKAEELRDLHRALIDPDVVVSQFEVQLGLFFAELGMAMATVPAAGKVLKRGLSAGKGVLQQGVKAGLKTAGKELVDDVVKAAIKELKGDLMLAFARELTQAFVMDQVMKEIIEPFVDALSESLDAPELEAGEEDELDEADFESLPIHEDDE